MKLVVDTYYTKEPSSYTLHESFKIKLTRAILNQDVLLKKHINFYTTTKKQAYSDAESFQFRYGICNLDPLPEGNHAGSAHCCGDGEFGCISWPHTLR